MKNSMVKLLAGVVVGSVGLSTLILTRRLKGPKSYYDRLPLIRLKNNAGMEVTISAVGAAITKCVVPDANGIKRDVVLGYAQSEEYVVSSSRQCMQATVIIKLHACSPGHTKQVAYSIIDPPHSSFPFSSPFIHPITKACTQHLALV